MKKQMTKKQLIAMWNRMSNVGLAEEYKKHFDRDRLPYTRKGVISALMQTFRARGSNAHLNEITEPTGELYKARVRQAAEIAASRRIPLMQAYGLVISEALLSQLGYYVVGTRRDNDGMIELNARRNRVVV